MILLEGYAIFLDFLINFFILPELLYFLKLFL